MRGEAGEPSRTVHLGTHLAPLTPGEEQALEVAGGGEEDTQQQGRGKGKEGKGKTAGKGTVGRGAKRGREVPDALRYPDNHVTTAK
jgi:hypothetical protein